MQLLVDTVGIIGELLRSGQISEVVRCKDCKHHLECDYWIENGDDWGTALIGKGDEAG